MKSLMCWLLGHNPYRPDKEHAPRIWFCKRCHKHLNLDGKI
jgi:hypothetical protein